MSHAHDNPDLDALVGVIELLQERIERDHEIIGPNETRTRMMLIDPLLNALGWDTADPAMVIPEYRVGDGAADYALLKATPYRGRRSPIIIIEAKRLYDDPRGYRRQMLNYANMEAVEYAALTNGDIWELYEVFKAVPMDDRRILSISLRNESASYCAVKLLPLKWPSLETGEALAGPQRLLAEALKSNAAPAVVESIIDRGASLGPWDNHGATPLHFAARVSANPLIIELLLDRGADIEAVTDTGWTPLHYAVAFSQESAVIALLLDEGADSDATTTKGETPLHIAAAWSIDTEALELLLNHGADITAVDGGSWTPLHAAVAENGNSAAVKLLLEHGADVAALDYEGRTPLHTAAACNEDPEVIELLLDQRADLSARDDDGWTALHHAVAHNAEPAVTQMLLDQGADSDATTTKGATPQQLAGSPEVLWLLRDPDENFLEEDFWRRADTASVRSQLDRGASIGSRADNGSTPLHIAAKWSVNPSAITVLIRAGAASDARDSKGWTSLHHAALNHESSPQQRQLFLIPDPLTGETVIETLLKNGADATARTPDDKTAYDIAKERGADLETLRLLCWFDQDFLASDFWANADEADVRVQVDRGADLNARDGNGQTPLHRAAAQSNDPAVIRTLLDSGANLHALTNNWMTPYEVAAKRGASEGILRLLRG